MNLRTLGLIMAVTASLGLTGCAGTFWPTPTNPGGVDTSATTTDEKALLGLVSLALTMEEAVELALDNGIITPGSERAVQVADLLEDLHTGIARARQLQRAADNANFTAQSLVVMGIIGDINALIQRR